MDETRTMKVGTVAEAAGLTVRTLHHWDSIGLLSPSERSPAGHREYTEADLVRLYQILALRNLGLGLESIAVCLDAGVDPARLVRDHLAEVEAAAAELEHRRARWPTTCWRSSGRSCTGGRSGTGPPAPPPTTRGCGAWWPGSTSWGHGSPAVTGGSPPGSGPPGTTTRPACPTPRPSRPPPGELTRYLDLARQRTHTKEQECA
jgi:DNA-binding transcriptional MerR regulator